jgi:hypothetical protein
MLFSCLKMFFGYLYYEKCSERDSEEVCDKCEFLDLYSEGPRLESLSRYCLFCINVYPVFPQS